MPKKTKRQKLLAELHRKSSAQQTRESHFVKSEDNSSHPQTILSSSHSFTYQHQGITKSKKTMLATDYTYIKKDLIKITIFTFAALTIQGVLYFILQR